MSQIGRRLDQAPLSSFHRRLRLAIGGGLFLDGIDIYLSAGVAGALIQQHFASLNDVGNLAIVTALGLAIGGLVAGWVADHVGRRRTMQATIGLVAACGVGASLAPTVPQLLYWRMAAAMALGGETVLGYGTMGEFIPPAVRGRWAAYLGLLANLGNPVCLLLGYWLLPYRGGWRWLLALPALGALAVWWVRRRMPESPRWLEAKGRIREAQEAVDRILGSQEPATATPNGRKAAESTSPSVFLPGTGADVLEPAPSWSRRLMVGISINVAIMCGIFGFVTWLPTFFVAAGRDLHSSLLFAGVMALGGPIGTAIGMLLTDRIERRWGVVVASIAAAALGVTYGQVHSAGPILLIGLLLVTVIYIFGTFGLVAYVPELFFTQHRMRLIGLCATAGRLVMICLPLLVIPLFKATGQAGVVALISGILLIEAAVVAVFGTNTRGRSLESIR